ncbi:hypothetical protein H2199_002241 [Coniosporium tulheliwenetii]|uniref:Uncharacterized protein n=1 Tax=Coniosporium tulheliwenetii TaxID=3383036 RepID=A0ACC2ZI87_9PEZI|nr:hypothetical protein H2199_002241 [Cladosporium sp. JES 115]
MRSLLLSFVLLIALAQSARIPKHKNSVWNVENFKSLIAFGDSYTDENRLFYFIINNGSAPPPGTLLPESFNTAGGGRTWPRYVVQYTGDTVNGEWMPQMMLYNYAVGGAVCSNEITPRYVTTFNANFQFPSVLEYEVPTFLADKASVRINTTEPYFNPALTASNSVYSLWIGTNDLGVGAFLTNNQIRGKVLSDYTSCVYTVLDRLYTSGARNFVLFNNAPLQLAPLYANDTLNGTGPGQYWPNKPENHTQIAETMHEYTTSTNTIFRYQTPFEAIIARRYPGANFANFDVWQLMSDIYHNPTEYLNGTQPANVSGWENHCQIDRTGCVLEYNGTSSDSFLWYDELHKSEQADRIIARSFVDVLNGASQYATYWSGHDGYAKSGRYQ